MTHFSPSELGFLPRAIGTVRILARIIGSILSLTLDPSEAVFSSGSRGATLRAWHIDREQR